MGDTPGTGGFRPFGDMRGSRRLPFGNKSVTTFMLMINGAILLSLAMLPQGPHAVSSRPESPQFHAPERLKAGDGYIKVEAPGYAAPCYHDVDGDGQKDLIVGQFAGGKLQVFKGKNGKFQKGDWLKAEGAIAEVPGVW